MTIKRQRPTEAETRRFVQRMKAMKQAEQNNGVEIFTDALMRATIVVKVDGVLWLVPKSANGWSRRQRLNMSPLVELERLRPALGITPEWLGVQGTLTQGACARESTPTGHARDTVHLSTLRTSQ